MGTITARISQWLCGLNLHAWSPWQLLGVVYNTGAKDAKEARECLRCGTVQVNG